MHETLYQMKQMSTINELTSRAHTIRKTIIEMAVPTVSHHIGCSLGIVDILVALYGSAMSIHPKNPKDPERDIFILSKGHGAAALYATLCHYGYFDRALLDTYDQDGSSMPEHVSTNVPGVEFSTGSLGHGLPVGLGYALSFIQEKKENKVYVLVSDGELNEGSNWEAIQFAGHRKLDNLMIVIDKNDLQGYAPTSSVIDLNPLKEKFEVFGWQVDEIDGHDIKEILSSLDYVSSQKPRCIIAKTVKGKGVVRMEGKFESHYKSLSKEDKQELLEELS